jgi:hypothetical protein
VTKVWGDGVELLVLVEDEEPHAPTSSARPAITSVVRTIFMFPHLLRAAEHSNTEVVEDAR